VKKRGSCVLPIDRIAAQAGVCRSTVKRALRAAQSLRDDDGRRRPLLRIEERRVSAWRNDTNVITIVDKEWSA
jgi:hypothetical protein